MVKTGSCDDVPLWNHLRRHVLRSSLVGLFLTDSGVIPLKLAGLLPPSVTWPGGVVLPASAAKLATIPFAAIVPVEFPGGRRLAFLGVTA